VFWPRTGLLVAGRAVYLDVKVLDAPLECLSVGVEEEVEAVATYSTASVEHHDRPVIIVARDAHLGAETVFFVGRHESVAAAYLVTTGRHTI